MGIKSLLGSVRQAELLGDCCFGSGVAETEGVSICDTLSSFHAFISMAIIWVTFSIIFVLFLSFVHQSYNAWIAICKCFRKIPLNTSVYEIT